MLKYSNIVTFIFYNLKTINLDSNFMSYVNDIFLKSLVCLTKNIYIYDTETLAKEMILNFQKKLQLISLFII